MEGINYGLSFLEMLYCFQMNDVFYFFKLVLTKCKANVVNIHQYEYLSSFQSFKSQKHRKN